MLTSGFLLLVGVLGRVERRLDLVGVDDAGQVSVGHEVLGDALVGGAVYDVESVERGLGPYVAIGGKLEEVGAVDATELGAGEVAEGALDAIVYLVDDEEATGPSPILRGHISSRSHFPNFIFTA